MAKKKEVHEWDEERELKELNLEVNETSQGGLSKQDQEIAEKEKELFNKGVKLGVPPGLIIKLLTTFGPIIVKLLVELLGKRKKAGVASTSLNALAPEQLELYLGRLLEFAMTIAHFTESTTDDAIVKVLREMIENTGILALLLPLIQD